MSVTKVVNMVSRLGECPVWNVKRRQLFWTDILGKKIWQYDPQHGNTMLFWEGDHMVGGFAFTANQQVVLCTDKGVYLLRADAQGSAGAQLQRCADVTLRPGERFNDITTDPQGRIFAGTDTSNCIDGIVYRLERGKKPKIVLRGIDCSNGMTFSMDEKFFYHVNSGARRITRYRYDRESGEISEPQIFLQGNESQGLPDGMTVDCEDCLWVAFWGEACVKRFDPSGRLRETVQVPASQVTSIMFGGADLNELYITTAGDNWRNPLRRDGFSDEGVFLGGPVYKLVTTAKGRAEWLADF